MSLLIKALANAEKDKQAKLNKTQAVPHDGDATLSLALEPKVAQPIADSNRFAAEKSAVQLSLEEEAGLGLIAAAVDKAVNTAPEQKKSDYARLEKPLDKAGTYKAKQSTLQPIINPAQQADELKMKSAQQPGSVKASDINQKTAAKVFVANQAAKTQSSKIGLLFLGVAGALIILLVLKGYTYFTRPVPLVVPTVAQPVMPELPIVAVAPSNTIELSQATPVAAEPSAEVTNEESFSQAATQEKQQSNASENEIVEQKISRRQTLKNSNPNHSDENAPTDDNDVPAVKTSRNGTKVPLKLSSKSPIASVDPVLLAAYQAFTRGEDASAQQQYRQVLLRDVRNVDALLGMAAIAQRQGRDADAAGWYQKVLDVEPQNMIAQSAMAAPQANTDIVSAESRIKSMLAQQPDAAHLHAALGNMYAEQSQWPSAQNAYFDASRFAPNNADYAFNLAISLDQMGKRNLALAQYLRALELLNQSGGTSPDRATLEARIQALQ